MLNIFQSQWHSVRSSMSSPWLHDNLLGGLLWCGSHCCNSTLPPPATCARVPRENTGFCVGVRRPHGGGWRYIGQLWQVASSPSSEERGYGRGCWCNSCTTVPWRSCVIFIMIETSGKKNTTGSSPLNHNWGAFVCDALTSLLRFGSSLA